MSDVLPLYYPAERVPMVTSAPVVAGQVVMISGDNTIAPTSGAVVPYGIAGNDDPVGGGTVMVWRAGIWVLTASGAIAANALVIPGASGVVTTIGSDTNYGHVVGIAQAAAANNKVTVAVQLA